MKGPENKVKEQVKKILKKYKVYWHMPVSNGMGAPSLDFVCCAGGAYLAIETKAPGKKPTPRQLLTIGLIESSHGKVLVIDGEKGLKLLEKWLCSKIL